MDKLSRPTTQQRRVFAFGVFVCSIQDVCYLQCQACLFGRQKCLCRSDFLTVGYFQKGSKKKPLPTFFLSRTRLAIRALAICLPSRQLSQYGTIVRVVQNQLNLPLGLLAITHRISDVVTPLKNHGNAVLVLPRIQPAPL